MSEAWLLAMVAPDRKADADVRVGSEVGAPRLHHAAWLLERLAGRVEVRRRGSLTSFAGLSWTPEHQVVVIEWTDDRAAICMHGAAMSGYHLVALAGTLRSRAQAIDVQQSLMQVLQAFEMARQEANAAAGALQKTGNGDLPPGGKIILLGH